MNMLKRFAAVALLFASSLCFGQTFVVNNLQVNGTFAATTPVGITAGGTGAATAAAARTALGAAATSVGLNQFAATTSTQLAGVVSDETGTGPLVFATGSAINPTSTGATTPGSGAFTSLNASTNGAMAATNTSGQSIPNNTFTTIASWVSTFDRTGSFNGTAFTAPATGFYLVDCGITYVAHTGSVNNQYELVIVTSATTAAVSSTFRQTTGSVAIGLTASALVSLTAGQTIFIQTFQNSGAAVTLLVNGASNWLSIVRVP